MTMTFGDAHLDTLTKLKVLVEKHGMKIRFGTKSDFTNDSDSSVLEEFNLSKEIIDVFDNLDILDGNFNYTYECLWFELYDPKPAEKHGEYHVMSYEHHNLDFQIVDDWEDEIDNEKLEKELEDLLDGTHNGIYLYSYPTHIRGFGNKEVITDGRVYREGMALHYFTELVCQYLNEPMINNTY